MNQQEAVLRQTITNVVAEFLSKLNPSEQWQENIRIVHGDMSEQLLKQFEQSQRRFKYHPAEQAPQGKDD